MHDLRIERFNTVIGILLINILLNWSTIEYYIT